MTAGLVFDWSPQISLTASRGNRPVGDDRRGCNLDGEVERRRAATENAVGYYWQMSQRTYKPPCGSRRRRRGGELERALHEATLAEMAEVGYIGLTMERIAARAHTGKAALYRRWRSKRDLVHAALISALPPLPEPHADQSTREQLSMVFTAHRDLLAGKTAFPGLDIIEQIVHVPKLRAIFADAVVVPRLRIVESILQSAVDNGEIDPATVIPLNAQIGPALINHHYLLAGQLPNRRQLALVVDAVIPPWRVARAK